MAWQNQPRSISLLPPLCPSPRPSPFPRGWLQHGPTRTRGGRERLGEDWTWPSAHLERSRVDVPSQNRHGVSPAVRGRGNQCRAGSDHRVVRTGGRKRDDTDGGGGKRRTKEGRERGKAAVGHGHGKVPLRQVLRMERKKTDPKCCESDLTKGNVGTRGAHPPRTLARAEGCDQHARPRRSAMTCGVGSILVVLVRREGRWVSPCEM
eukprot:scaffold172_cov341-Pavlova_lutheri.AAC.27